VDDAVILSIEAVKSVHCGAMIVETDQLLWLVSTFSFVGKRFDVCVREDAPAFRSVRHQPPPP
jgi:hypothetical protein